MMNTINYQELRDDTKKIINKAIEIYMAIKDQEICKDVFYIKLKPNYNFTKLDKKVLSLFLACFITDTSLKTILKEYDDINVPSLYSYIGLDPSNIMPLPKEEYPKYFEEYFQLELINMIKNKSFFFEINQLTPEVIYWLFDAVEINKSFILNCYLNNYNHDIIWFCDHPSCKSVESKALINGDIVSISNNKNSLDKYLLKNKINKPTVPIEKKEKNTDVAKKKYWEILDEIKVKFIGQEKFVEDIFYNIVNNLQLAKKVKSIDGERSIIFVDGPTGTGKTAVVRDITDKLDVPFTKTSATNYSATGYVGGNLTDLLSDLYKKSHNDLDLAQQGIIVLDEFDKLAVTDGYSSLEMKRAVQQQLLDFMGGGKYNIVVGDSLFNRHEVEFDTSKLTFICLGALTTLRNSKKEPPKTIGFSSSVIEPSGEVEFMITPQDLVDTGISIELAGRFNTFLHTKEYSLATLLDILKNSTISPLIGFKNLLESNGKSLVIDDDVYEVIAAAAYNLNTGARSLQTIVNSIRTYYLKEILRGQEKIIYLDKSTVSNIITSTFKRRGR